MKRHITLQQYRNIDLCLMVGLLLLAEFGIYIAKATVYSGQLFQASPSGTIIALVMMRWNGWAAIPAVVGGLLYGTLRGGLWPYGIVYGIGNLLSLAALGWFRMGKDKLRSSALPTMAFGLTVQVLMQLGRGCVALVLTMMDSSILGAGNHLQPLETFLSFITADSLSILFTVVALWIVRRIEGLFEDQKSYLLRVQNQERQVEGREQF